MPTDSASNHHSSSPVRSIVCALIVVVISWIWFAFLAAGHPSGSLAYERSWIEAFRSPADSTQMVGPRIVEETFRDFSALGGYAVTICAITSFAVYTGLRYGRSSVRFFLITVLGGFGCSMLLKLVFGRDRPTTVPHLSFVATTSFPSGHSMMSSIVYLTIGLLLSQRFADRKLHWLFLIFPFCLTGLVGCSRVAMGVHYPTDVLAGWTAGLLWTAVAFQLQNLITGNTASPDLPSTTTS
jgi:undecaprenyl-diphosphatase